MRNADFGERVAAIFNGKLISRAECNILLILFIFVKAVPMYGCATEIPSRVQRRVRPTGRNHVERGDIISHDGEDGIKEFGVKFSRHE